MGISLFLCSHYYLLCSLFHHLSISSHFNLALLNHRYLGHGYSFRSVSLECRFNVVSDARDTLFRRVASLSNTLHPSCTLNVFLRRSTRSRTTVSIHLLSTLTFTVNPPTSTSNTLQPRSLRVACLRSRMDGRTGSGRFVM